MYERELFILTVKYIIIGASVIDPSGITGDSVVIRNRSFGLLKNYGYEPAPRRVAAEIVRGHGTVTLKCSGEPVSWWFYPCPGGDGAIRMLPLHPGNWKRYNLVSTGRFSSSVIIKNAGSRDVAGLYRCQKTLVGLPSERLDHYFVVGERTALRRCFHGNSGMLKTIHGLIGAAEDMDRDGKTYEYILKLPYGSSQIHEYKIRFSLRETDGASTDRKLGNLNMITFDVSDAVDPPRYEIS